MSSSAKLTPPRLGDTHPRERLFERLDEARTGASVWITGLPGAGKTTLMASYVQSRELSALWYQVDAGDSDPATLFHALREAAPARRRAPLPLLAPAHRGDVEGFARRFFRMLFERMQRPTVVVFDNFHEVAAGDALHAIVRTAMTEAPPSVDVVVISREDPSATFARLAAHGQLATLTWEDLRLNAEESAAIVALHSPQAAAHSAQLHQRAGGWAAGITLLLKATSATVGDIAPEGLAATGLGVPLLFDYLASEVFAHAPARLRTLWLRTAQLPHFTAEMAAALSGSVHAGRLLETLWRRRYFIDQCPGAEVTYQYHPLFKKFLCDRLQRGRSAPVRAQQTRCAAKMLEQHGDPEAALVLYREAGDWTAATRLLVAQAQDLFAVGRIQTLNAWIAALPAAVVAEHPGLLFWRGCCKAQTGAASAARRDLADAFERQTANGDTAGQCLSAAAAIESYILEWNEFTGLDHWIEALRRLLAERPHALAEPTLELRIQSALLLALAYRAPQDAMAPVCAERVLQLCRAEVGPAEKLSGATALMQYLTDMKGVAQMAQAIAEFGPLARSASTTAMQRVLWHWSSTKYFLLVADGAATAGIIRETRALCTENGLGHFHNFLRLFSLWGVLSDGDLPGAHRELAAIGRELDGLRSNDVALHHFMQSWLALLEHQPRVALQHAGIASRMAEELGSAGPIISSACAYSQALIACGETERALLALRVPKNFATAAGAGSARFTILMFEADALLQLGRRDQFRQALQAALLTGRCGGFSSTIVWLPEMISRLCAEALNEGIEVEYVEHLIAVRRLLAPRLETEHWPRPLRIYALGRFSIQVDGVPLEFKRKAQSRPLALLKSVLALGGRGVEHGALLEQLWPDLDGDAARNAFDLALHRLRQLLVHADVLIMEDGQLRLDARRVWVDAWAFERLCSHINLGSQATLAEIEEWGRGVLRLYHGPLLAGEEAAWALAGRQRLRSKFERSLSQLADELQRRGSAELTIDLYRGGVDIEPQSEVLQRGLINAYRAHGRHGEAATAYRAFRDLLAVTLGVAPGPDTQALYRSLQNPLP